MTFSWFSYTNLVQTHWNIACHIFIAWFVVFLVTRFFKCPAIMFIWINIHIASCHSVSWLNYRLFHVHVPIYNIHIHILVHYIMTVVLEEPVLVSKSGLTCLQLKVLPFPDGPIHQIHVIPKAADRTYTCILVRRVSD